jgi:hypothetical protein
VDSRLDRVAGQVNEVKILTDQLCGFGNKVDEFIKARAQITEERIKHLTDVQRASAKFWTIVGSAVIVMTAIKAVSGGWMFWKWLQRRKKNQLTNESEGKSAGVELLGQRMHPRDWNVRNEMRFDD